MNINLPRLEPWQMDVAKDLTNIKGSGKIFSVLSSRQCGKSVLMAEALIHFAGNNPGTVSIITEPTFSQNKQIFATIKSFLVQTPIVKSMNNSDMSIELTNGSKIICKSCAQRDGLRGFTCDFLAVDEACFTSEDIWPLILPWTNAKNAPILMVSTPLFPEGTFYNFWSNPDNVTYFSYNWSKYDKSKYLSKERLEYFRKRMPKHQFEAEFLGKWILDGAYVFKNVTHCIIEKDNLAPKYAAIDWSLGNGGDYTVVVLMNDMHNITDLYYWNDISPNEQLEKIANIINSNTTLKSVKAEQNSLGTVYIDQLKQKLLRKQILHSFLTTNDSKKEIIENLAADFENNAIGILDDDELISQLNHYTIEKTKNGYTYNALKGFHDDMCMALAFCNSHFHTKKGNYSISFK